MCQSEKLGLTPTELAALPLDPIQISVRPTGTTSLLTIRGKTYEEALAKLQYNIQSGSVFGRTAVNILNQYEANKPRELFPGATLLASVVASAGVGAAGAPAWVTSSLSELHRIGASNMSLNLGGILGAAGGILGGINTSQFGNISQILGGGLQIAGAALTPAASYGPVYSPAPSVNYPQAQPVGAFSVPAAVGAAMASRLAPVLTKIAVKLGMRAKPSLNRAMEIVRKTAKLLGSPEAVAVALGITTAELAQLITTSQARRRRRMNPANSRALRRAARRIKSFHRLCTHTDLLRTRHRSAPVRYAFQKRKCK